MLYLFMGVIWLCVGGTMLYFHFTNQKVPHLNADGTFMLGLFALLLSTYNFVRWWAARATARARAKQRRPKPQRRDPNDRPQEYNPALDFTRPDGPPERIE